MNDRELLKRAYDETWNAGSEYPIPSFDGVISFANKLNFLKEDLVRSKQELCPSCKNSDIYACTCTFKKEQPAVALEQEPVGQLLEDAFGRGQVMWFNKPVDGSYVYTTPPPQRTWVYLTDEEIEARAINFYNPEMYKRAVLWAQEKLKERNQ